MGGDDEREAATAFCDAWRDATEAWGHALRDPAMYMPTPMLGRPARLTEPQLRAVLAENARMRERFGELGDGMTVATELLDRIAQDDACQLDHHGGCLTHSLHEAPCPHPLARQVVAAWRAVQAAAAPQQPASDESATKPRDWWRTRGACRHCGCDVHQDDPAATVGDGVAHVRCQQRVQEYEAEGAARQAAKEAGNG